MGMIYSTYLVMITHREGVDGAGDVTNVIDTGGIVVCDSGDVGNGGRMCWW